MRRAVAVGAAVAVAALSFAWAPLAPARPTPTLAASSERPCPDWGMYGRTTTRTFSTDCPSGIDTDTLWRLLPAWFIDTPYPVTASPAVVDGTLYVGSWDGVMYAVDAASGAVRWRHQTPPAPGATFGPIVSSAAVSDVAFDDGATRRLVVFGSGPRVFALDARDGRPVWVHDASNGVRDTPTEYESSPLVHGDLVLIGRDTHDEPGRLTGGVRGGLVALDARTGAVRWVFEPEADRGAVGCGGVWSSPTLDEARGYAYFGTANCPHDDVEWTPYTNAVVAVRVADGSPVWSFQPGGPPDDDTDFGATPNLFVDRNGREVLGAGKKDGTYYALDPATGTLLWRTHVADPLPGVGGFIGSPAVHRGRIYGGTAIGLPPYQHSLEGTTGNVRWQRGIGPSYGATTVVNGVVFNAALDSLLKAYDARTGYLLWSMPVVGPSSSSAVIVGDSVYLGSGTSSSDLCAKDNVTDELCAFLFDGVIGALGGIHAFRLLPLPGD